MLILSLSLPPAACLIHKVPIWNVVTWRTLSVVLQFFLFQLADLIFRGIPDLIGKDIAAPALVLAAFKLSGSIILAFAG